MLLYHLTDRADFRPDPKRHPRNNTTLGGDWPVPGIFLSDNVEHWTNGYGYWQPWVVEFEVPSGVAENYDGQEFFLAGEDFPRAHIVRVVPLDAHCREQYQDWGWTEDFFGTTFDTGEPLPPKEPGSWQSHGRFPGGYRFNGDVRSWSSSQQQTYKKRVRDYARKSGRTNGVYGSLADAMAARGNRRCESCGGAMPRRMYRQRDDNDLLVCDSCKVQGFGAKEWAVAYAKKVLPAPLVEEFQRREAEALASLVRVASAGHWELLNGYIYMEGDQAVYELVPSDSRHGWFDLINVRDGSYEVERAFPSLSAAMHWVDAGVTAMRKQAHDSGDGETIYHCPFCGSGAVTGGPDGTVSCDFCHQHFTVQVQPEFKAMPQTIDGTPFNIPGMPGGGPDAGAAPAEEAAAQGEVQQGQPGEPPDIKQAPDAAEKPKPPEKKKAPPVAARLLVQGVALPYAKGLQHLAIRYADDREQVLPQVRAENGVR